MELLFNIEPDLRRLRTYLAVSESGSVQRAAQKLHLTLVGTELCAATGAPAGLGAVERTRGRGMVPTQFGTILSERVRRAMLQLDAVEKELITAHAKAGTARYPKGFSNKVTRRQLSAFLSIASCRTERGAAQQTCSEP